MKTIKRSDINTMRDGWYECENCGRPILIATMDDVRRYGIRVRRVFTENGTEVEYTGRCPNCWSPSVMSDPVLRKTGFFRTIRLVWEDVMKTVKER